MIENTLVPVSNYPSEFELKAQLNRIVRSAVFAGSEILRDLLTFLATRALESPGEHLKVKEIATRVFHRSEDFDSQTDSVVRVHMGRLRSKLAEFYMSEGAGEDLIMEVPRGAYFLAFHTRNGATPVVPEPSESLVVGSDVIPMQANTTGRLHHLIPWTLAALLLVLSGWLTFQNQRLNSIIHQEDSLSSSLPWSAMLGGSHQINIVSSDSGYAFSQELAHRTESLAEYIGGVCPAAASVELDAISVLLCRREFTVWADVVAATRILELSPRLAKRSVVRYGRYMHIEDFKETNSVLLGTTRSNHWIELFDHYLNFHMEYDDKLAKHLCRNRSPRTGERAIYMPAGPTGTTGEAYGTIALVPNLSGDGYVLLLTGTNTESTQAAAEFVTNPARIANTLRGMGIDPTGPPRSFEILLKVMATAGSPDASEPLAYRVGP